MADRPWRTSGSRSSLTPWRSSAPRTTTTRQRSGRFDPERDLPKSGGGSVGGFFGNLAEDITNAVVGIGPAAVKSAQALADDARTAMQLSGPTRRSGRRSFKSDDVIVKPVVESYRYTYGPLARGDIGEFAHRVYEHPLGPILDLATVASFGAGAAAKAGLAPAAVRRGATELRGPGGTKVFKPLPRQTLRAELQVGRKALLDKLPSETRSFGEGARFARQVRKGPLRVARSRELLEVPFLKSLNKLRRTDERTAAFWLSQLPDPKDLAAYVRELETAGGEQALAQAAIIKTEGFLKNYVAPSPKITRALEEATYVAEAQRVILGITPEVARQRAYMPTLLARGAKYAEDDEGGIALAPADGFNSIDEMIAKVDVDLEAAGRPKPTYMPHTSEVPKPGNIYGTGGAGPQKNPGSLRQTGGVLFSRGQVISDPQVLRQSFVKSIKWALYKDVHQLHLEHGKKIPRDQPIPKGWQVVRRQHSERTPYIVKSGADFEEFAKQYLDKDAGFEFPENPFVTTGDDALVTEDGFRVIVPKEFSRQLAGEFVRAGSFARAMNAYPLRVWRHLVLKLRPAWLVNNILGNSLLYFVHNADPIAVQEFARTFRNLVPKKQQSAFDKLLQQHFPEQIHGTFMGSQLPVFGGYGKLAKMERVSSWVGAGLAQVDRTWEAGLRSSIVRTELRKSPELRKFSGAMRKQTDDFWKLADEELAKNPLLAERVSDRVNDALGDYLALGRVERDVIRSAFPFYAWYRVITLITLRLPLTHPLKAQLLARLGQAGAQSALEELGMEDESAINLARGFASLGTDADERVRGINTTASNPLATVAQMQDFVAALAGGEPGKVWEVAPGINPFIGVPIEVATGAKPKTGYKGSNRFGIFSSAPSRFFMALPEVRLAQALLGQQYQGTPESPTLYDRDTQDEILRYLGVPYARVSPERIQEISSGN